MNFDSLTDINQIRILYPRINVKQMMNGSMVMMSYSPKGIPWFYCMKHLMHAKHSFFRFVP